jgi:hypothetical protein
MNDMIQAETVIPQVSLKGLDWAAPWVDLQDELIERASQARYEAGITSTSDADFEQLREWADKIIERKAI